jgi:hypothetical protein
MRQVCAIAASKPRPLANSIKETVLLVVAPLTGALVLTWWLGAYAIVFGVTLIVVAFKLKGQLG